GSPLPQEAMREFRVHLNPYDAQYTRGASFVISAVTQRGTNEVHGSVFGYGQSNALKALDLSQREKRTANPAAFAIPDYSRGQLGFNLRGPIRRDRLFFAVSYEGQSTNAGFKAKYWIHSVQLRHTYTPSSGFVNEASLNVLSWSHNESPLVPGVTLLYPSITFGTSGFPLILKETHVRLIDRVTHTLGQGRHILTGGVEVARVHTNSWLPSNRDGFFRFSLDSSSLPNLGRIGVGFFDTTSAEDARAI